MRGHLQPMLANQERDDAAHDKETAYPDRCVDVPCQNQAENRGNLSHTVEQQRDEIDPESVARLIEHAGAAKQEIHVARVCDSDRKVTC